MSMPNTDYRKIAELRDRWAERFGVPDGRTADEWAPYLDDVLVELERLAEALRVTQLALDAYSGHEGEE